MKTIIETQNFYLREFCPQDAESLYLLNLDPDVIKYTGDVAFESVEAAETFIGNYDHYRTQGFGRWAVILKKNDQFVGWCGLRKSSETGEIDLGFRFMKQYWHKGFATETATACIQFAFLSLGIQSIIGRAMIDNKGSIRVLEKIGMTYARSENCAQSPGIVYKIEK